jgi:hypothetical protein
MMHRVPRFFLVISTNGWEIWNQHKKLPMFPNFSKKKFFLSILFSLSNLAVFLSKTLISRQWLGVGTCYFANALTLLWYFYSENIPDYLPNIGLLYPMWIVFAKQGMMFLYRSDCFNTGERFRKSIIVSVPDVECFLLFAFLIIKPWRSYFVY